MWESGLCRAQFVSFKSIDSGEKFGVRYQAASFTSLQINVFSLEWGEG